MSDTVRTWRHIQQRYNLVGEKETLKIFNFQEKEKYLPIL